MTERTSFSPSGQEIYRGNIFDRAILRRISRVALSLPDEFDEKGKSSKLHVHGTAGQETYIKIDENVTEYGDEAMRYTAIGLTRSDEDERVLTGLDATTYVTDEVGDLTGKHVGPDVFVLGASDNTLSLFRVMRMVTQATNVVEWANTLDYLATADPVRQEGTFPKIF